MPAHGCRPGDENFVVGLCLVTHHADFVALAVVQVNMNRLLKSEGLKVGESVIDVHDSVEIGAVIKSHQVFIGWRQQDRQ
ncbi:unannotated protein [freshwater metagenome]|uniref:Unannotated protein n=1 Tax=freshwater metagenome TaxID=449393 RepID=A0A6J7DXP5_9ZZZZ